MFKTRQRSIMIRSAATAAAAVAIAAVGAAPALAYPVDHPMTNGGDVDSGSVFDPVLMQPVSGGNLSWDQWNVTDVRPAFSTQLYTQNLAGLHVKVKLSYKNAWGDEITSRTSPAQMVNGSPDTVNLINFTPYWRSDIYAVQIMVLKETAAGIYVQEGSSVTETIW